MKIKIDVLQASNCTGLSINGQRITRTKLYGMIRIVESYEVEADEIIDIIKELKKDGEHHC